MRARPDFLPEPAIHVEHLLPGPDGWLPNNPLIAYRGLRLADGDVPDATAFERMFDAHGGSPDGRGGVYDGHHDHSSAHEFPGV